MILINSFIWVSIENREEMGQHKQYDRRLIFIFLIGVWLLYNAVLASAIQWNASAYTSLPLGPSSHLPPSHLSRSSESAELSSLAGW